MLDHVTLSFTDLPPARRFYEAVLAPLGYRVKKEFNEFVGFGDERKPYLWLKSAPVQTTPLHLAFVAKNRRAVDAFHAAALAAGATDDGAPGLRPHYHEHFYGAFVIDPSGHHIEACCHLPE